MNRRIQERQQQTNIRIESGIQAGTIIPGPSGGTNCKCVEGMCVDINCAIEQIPWQRGLSLMNQCGFNLNDSYQCYYDNLTSTEKTKIKNNCLY
jgi:peptidase E